MSKIVKSLKAIKKLAKVYLRLAKNSNDELKMEHRPGYHPQFDLNTITGFGGTRCTICESVEENCEKCAYYLYTKAHSTKDLTGYYCTNTPHYQDIVHSPTIDVLKDVLKSRAAWMLEFVKEEMSKLPTKYKAVYMPATENHNPSKKGFLTLEAAEAYIAEQFCDDCKLNNASHCSAEWDTSEYKE